VEFFQTQVALPVAIMLVDGATRVVAKFSLPSSRKASWESQGVAVFDWLKIKEIGQWRRSISKKVW
jgi:hypothetical protein